MVVNQLICHLEKRMEIFNFDEKFSVEVFISINGHFFFLEKQFVTCSIEFII